MSVRERLLIRLGDRFLVVNGTLPELAPGFELQDSIAPICQAASRLVGAPGILSMRLLAETGNLNLIDCDAAAARVGTWRGLDEVEEHVDGEQAEALRAGGGAPWYRAEFHSRLLDFARRALRERGVDLEHAPEQVRVSPLSCIYRLPCAGGDHWVKATRPGAFAPEGAVMSALHGAFPARVPAPLAFENDVALFADFGERMQPSTPHDVVAAAAASLARLQLESHDMLSIPGLQSWRPGDLRQDLDASRAVLGDDADGVLERIGEAVEELVAFGIGDTLVHGDFYWGNVALLEGEPCIFDWSDAGIGHPFFDPLEAFANPEPGRRERVRAAYLEVWREAVDADVDAAWEIARRLGPAHHLARNTRLLSHFEPWERPGCEPNLQFWARLAREAFQAPALPLR